MRLNFTLIAGFLIYFNSLFAQKEPAEFGDVSTDELSMQSCKLDSTADAVILFDKGEFEINANGIQYRRHTRIKLFRKNSFNTWGHLHLTTSKSTVFKFRGNVYNNENGLKTVTEVNKQNIFKKKVGKHLEENSVAFPNVREGSIIEYNYSIDDYYSYNQLHGYGIKVPSPPTWSFQSEIPTLWSRYSIKTRKLKFIHKLNGYNEINAHEESKDGTFHYWTMTSIPSFKGEKFMPDPGFFKSTIRFSPPDLSWNVINGMLSYRPYFNGIPSDSITFLPIVKRITSGMKDPLQKAKAISEYVKENISWDGSYDVLGDDPVAILNRKTGSSGDINLFFGNLLRFANLKVNIVLISTRDHGLILNDFPSPAQFNYAICRISKDSTYLLLDATEKKLPFNLLPEVCLNYDGLSIDSRGGEWVKVKAAAKHKTSVNANFTLLRSGDISGSLEFVRDGYSAFEARSSYEKKGKEDYLKDLFKDRPIQVEKSEFIDLENIEKPLREKLNITISNELTAAGEMLYVNPIVVFREDQNPFITETREYPIDLGTPKERVYIATLNIPAEFEVEQLPTGKILVTQDKSAKFIFSYSQTGNQIFVTHTLQINKTLFLRNEYSNLREFYSRLVSKMAEQIVLKKKK